jgi:hypothetical protein
VINLVAAAALLALGPCILLTRRAAASMQSGTASSPAIVELPVQSADAQLDRLSSLNDAALAAMATEEAAATKKKDAPPV